MATSDAQSRTAHPDVSIGNETVRSTTSATEAAVVDGFLGNDGASAPTITTRPPLEEGPITASEAASGAGAEDAAGGGNEGREKTSGVDGGGGEISTDQDKSKVPHKWGPCLCAAGSDSGHKTVMVESRTWPGINKPGGPARITKRCVVVEETFGEEVANVLYDVKYLLGGSEKKVRETYITCVEEDDGEARKIMKRDLYTIPVNEITPKPKRRAPSPKRARTASSTSSRRSPKKNTKSVQSDKPKRRLLCSMDAKQAPRSHVPTPVPAMTKPLARTHPKPLQKENAGKSAVRETATPESHQIVDLMQKQGEERDECPLAHERMTIFTTELAAIFGRAESMSLSTFSNRLKERASGLGQAHAPFEQLEVKKALEFLDSENKVLFTESADIYIV